jgi:hypothetical protein
MRRVVSVLIFWVPNADIISVEARGVWQVNHVTPGASDFSLSPRMLNNAHFLTLLYQSVLLLWWFLGVLGNRRWAIPVYTCCQTYDALSLSCGMYGDDTDVHLLLQRGYDDNSRLPDLLWYPYWIIACLGSATRTQVKDTGWVQWHENNCRVQRGQTPSKYYLLNDELLLLINKKCVIY